MKEYLKTLRWSLWPALLLGTLANASDASDFEAAIREFAEERRQLAHDIACRLDLTLPPEADAFFRAATTGHWESVSNHFSQVKQQTIYGTAVPALRNELWATIHETFGIWEVWVGWERDSSLLEMFHAPVMASMPRGSIYFGGTAYGRFVITTVNAVRNPPPLFSITQNALADNTYASHVQAIYGDRIWAPIQEDSARAFQRYIDEVNSGERPKNAEIEIVNGRIKVSGALGVMEINGIICEDIFKHNKDIHEFFVEESYVLQWMYPYLEPHGLIMKLNPEPLESLSAEAIGRDRAFWADYEKRLNKNPGFADNDGARRAFSKLRSASAGVYEFRELYDEAESAFLQSIRLYAVSPEASFRLAKMYAKQERIDDAISVMEMYIANDPPYSRDEAEEYLRELREKEAQESNAALSR